MRRHQKPAFWVSFVVSMALCLSLPAVSAAVDHSYASLLAKAEAGDTDSQLEVGNGLLLEAYVSGDVQPGLDWIVRAANAGNVKAQLRLGWLYSSGVFFKADSDQAMAWYRKASAIGSAEASLAVARHYDDAPPDTRDAAEALKWYEVAANQGSDDAALEVGLRYDTGTGGATVDHVKAMQAYARVSAANAGKADRLICANNAAPSSSDEDWARALPYCRKLEVANDPTGIYAMGLAHTYGKGVKKDAEHGLEELMAAADLGHPVAMSAIGDIYLVGEGVPQDAVVALDWHRKSMHGGSRSGILAVAQQYERGQGTGVNLAGAARLYELLGRNGNSRQAPLARAWFDAHPQFSAETQHANVIGISKIPRNLIMYDVPPKQVRDNKGKVISETPQPPADLIDYVGLLGDEVYPERALENEVEGSAAVECFVTAAGTLTDCIQLYERPEGYGFGGALDKIVDKLGRSRNKADWVGQYAGKSFAINFRFRLP